MREWREVALGDVIELKRGYDLPKRARADGPFPIVSSSGISGSHSEAKVRGPGVVTGRYGTLGQVSYLAEDFWPLNTSLYVRNFKGNNARFVALLLESMDLAQHDGAAAVPGLNRNQLHTVPVRVPDRSIQDRIASIVESIDNLIENNRRRVEVMEETARAIYRQWFVRFRYPGHEDVSLVDSPVGPIPDGWAALTIGDVLELRYGKALKKNDRRGGSVAVVSSAGIVGWHDETLVSGPAIVVGRKGNVGSVTWVDGDSWPIDTAYFVETELPLRYVAEQLRRTEFLNTHAAVPGLSRDQAYSRPFLRPPHGIMERFESVVGSLADEGRVLALSSERLASIRELLVPRLVTGRIDVSHLDLDALTEAASA